MKKVALILFLCLLLTGCPFGYDVSLSNTQYILLESDSIFSVNSSLHIRLKTSLPVVVYNPNQYEIEVSADKIPVIIQPHGSYVFVVGD